MQSFTFVSFTRELPIGLPPCRCSAPAVARMPGVTWIDSPSSSPLYPLV